ESQEEVSIIEILFHYLRYWKYFVLSIIVCLGVAYVYLLFTTPEYIVSSKVLINDDKKGQLVDMTSAFSDIGIVQPKSNVDNEIEILRSQTLMGSVVDSLHLYIGYFKSGKIRKREIYKETPVFVSIPQIMNAGSFTVDLENDSILTIHSNVVKFDGKVEMGKELNSPWGILKFTPNPFQTESFPIEIALQPFYFPNVDVSSVSKTSSVVQLSLITPSPRKGQDIINTLVALYNKNAIRDKNYVANNTIDFIDNRLGSVTGDLQSAEKTVENYQKEKGITDIQAQGQILLASSNDLNKQMMDAGRQMGLLKTIQDYLMVPANQDKGLPSNIGVTDPTILTLIGKYNDLVLEKKKMTEGMTANHPMLIQYNDQLALLRADLLRGLDISEASIQSNIDELQRQDNMNVGRTRDLTTQERESHDLLRQSAFKETLYTYLLQKREDTELALVTATPNAKVIDPASVGPIPVKPKKMIILLAALMAGAILAAAIIYLKDLFDNKIHTKEDVTRVISAPFLGIIPVSKGSDPFPVLKMNSSITERFRTVISNLEFIVGSERRKVIAVTSYTSGDGKSFFSRNLAMSLATLGKKTLLVDLDLRKSVLVKTLGMTNTKKGSALFLSDSEVQVNDIIDASHTFHKNLDIIPVYIFPPNPAELLSSQRLEQLFQTIGRDYEYIVVDTAPVGLVADAFNINAYSLSTIFLLRSDSTLKKILPEVQELYKDKRLNNLSVVLNSVSDENIYGYGHYGNHKHNYYTDD
ncbi:MAG: polysaccharide biosynthesis tyrosine autokinase, partial [Candidatus Azobacteroides sp.]|nr:polysaccharide biosynthesis tyrosine autokinase [Candidatus Azobacteroides sp.]